MRADMLIATYGEMLRDMSHSDYVWIVEQIATPGPATTTAIALAKRRPETRLTNVLNYRVLRFIHCQETGERSEMDCSGLDL